MGKITLWPFFKSAKVFGLLRLPDFEVLRRCSARAFRGSSLFFWNLVVLPLDSALTKSLAPPLRDVITRYLLFFLLGMSELFSDPSADPTVFPVRVQRGLMVLHSPGNSDPEKNPFQLLLFCTFHFRVPRVITSISG